jgi:type IV secretory pathway protease TraF
VGITGHYEAVDHHGRPVVLNCVRTLAAGEVLDLTKDNQANYDFFTKGPGYKANE